MAVKASANAIPNRVPERWFDFFEKKGHRAFLWLQVVALAKLIKSEANFAKSYGTMPRQAVESSCLKLHV
ncbi:hypothetical protein ACFLXQ_05620 [Chloroflexota bacterium]